MLYKILEKYSDLKEKHKASQEGEVKLIEEYDKNIIKNFLQLYDKDVKKIHKNQQLIENDLQSLYTESKELITLTNDAKKCYDNLVEYFKEAGDLYNWCTILEKEIDEVESLVKSNMSKETK